MKLPIYGAKISSSGRMGKENVVDTHMDITQLLKGKKSYHCDNMDPPGDYDIM